MIKYLHHHQIDFSRWDQRIASSEQSLIYAYSWYLDIVSPQWQAIVLDNYKAVWPITSLKKWGISYISQPLFAQQLGIFGEFLETEERQMLELLAEKFRYAAHLNLNKSITNLASIANNNLSHIQTKLRYNHELSLNKSYTEIYLGYHQDRKNNLKKGLKQNWQLTESQDIEFLITLFDQNHSKQITGGINPKTYQILRALFVAIQSRNLGKLVYATKDGKIEAGAWFVKSGQKIIYLFNAASLEGRLGNARTVLIDHLLKSEQNTAQHFDFESPSIKSIDNFYKSFGANTCIFDQLSWNGLPIWINQIWAMKKALNLKRKELSANAQLLMINV